MTVRLHLTWIDPDSGQRQECRGTLPIAIGRNLAGLPRTLDGEPVCPLVLPNDKIYMFHASLRASGDGVLLMPEYDSRTMAINDRPFAGDTVVSPGDCIRIGPYELRVRLDSSSEVSGRFPIESSRTQSTPKAGSGGSAVAGLTVAGAAMGSAAFEVGETCQNRVGFLFKRTCGRTSPTGCRYCRGTGVLSNDIFYNDYDSYYPGYGRYRYWGSSYYSNRHNYYYDRDSERMAFTEADSAAFEEEADMDFEQDLEAS